MTFFERQLPANLATLLGVAGGEYHATWGELIGAATVVTLFPALWIVGAMFT